MADAPHGGATDDPADDTGTATGPESPPGMPRWLKVSALIAGVLILLVVAVMLISGGDHGPSRHGPGSSGPGSSGPGSSGPGSGAPGVEAPESPGGDARAQHAPPAGVHG